MACCPARSLADFLKELPVNFKRAEPFLAQHFAGSAPLERGLKLRELQTSFVFTTVLAKKCKVQPPIILMSSRPACKSHSATLAQPGSSQECLIPCQRYPLERLT
jgi:hypothetical protein